jgi:hypothetical protein
VNRSRIAPFKCAAALFLSSLLLIACATRPESIHASYVSYEKYMDLDCPAMATKMVETRAQLARYSELQNSKANGDAWGVFLLGIPFSKLSGDVEGDVARLKGEVEALDTAEIKKKCGSETAVNTTPAVAKQAPEAVRSTEASAPSEEARVPHATQSQSAPTAAGEGLIPVGTSWTYNFSDRIYTGNDIRVTVKVVRSDDQIVEEQL